MKKPTCTFPDYKFRRITRKETVNIGDLYNHRHPILQTDNWEGIGRPSDWNGYNVKLRKGWIVIRPLN